MQVKTQVEDLQNYLTDASNMPGGHAERLLVPETADEVAAVLREANEAGASVTISGARTGTVGGAVPFGGYVISLERLNKIKSIDRDAKSATVEPGVVLADLQKAVEAEGLYYPPDPTEWSCQIGGTVATNASGARSFKYGATREFVSALTVVLADGDVLRLRRGEVFANEGVVDLVTESGRSISAQVPTYKRPNVRKNVSGYFNETPLDAIDLFIGSEGTLGVITEIELRLVPKPEGFFSGVVFFEKHGDLLGFVDEVKAASSGNAHADTLSSEDRGNALTDVRASARVRASASLVEYFDDRALSFIREKFPKRRRRWPVRFISSRRRRPKPRTPCSRRGTMLERHGADIDRSWFTTMMPTAKAAGFSPFVAGGGE